MIEEMRKIYSIIVVICLLFTYVMPIAAFAEDNTLTGDPIPSNDVAQEVYENENDNPEPDVSQEVYSEPNADSNSTTSPPENYVPQNTFIDKTLRMKAAALDQKRVLLIEDNNPWNTTSNQEVLAGLTEFDKVTTNDFLSVDLSKYGMVVFANDQPFSMYENYKAFKEYLEVFASIGGVIVFGACDAGWAGGTLNEDLPGNVKKESNFQYRNYIADSKHPIVNDSLTESLELENADLYENYASHISFDESSLPVGSRVILRENTTNKPTLVEYPLGKGRVIASGLTWEYNYVHGGESHPQGGYRGKYAQKAMDDLFKYGLYVSDIQRDDLKVLQNYYISKNIHYIFVGDYTTHMPIKNATIKINGYEVNTNENGLAEVKEQFGENTVEISADYYRKSKMIYNVRPRTARYFYLREIGNSNQPYLSMAMLKDSNGYVDLLNQSLHFTEDSPRMCNVILSGEWGGVPARKYIMYQKDKSVESADGKFNFAPGKIFKPGEKIYAIMIGADGTKSDPLSVGILISPKTISGEAWPDGQKGFKIGQEMGLTVSNDLPVLGGTDLNLKLDFIPISFVREGNKVKFGVGISDAAKMRDNWTDFKSTMDKVKANVHQTYLWDELRQKYGSKKGYLSIKKGWEPELKVAGYGEGIIDDDGKITSISGYLVLDASASYQHQMQYIVGPVPVYVELGGGVALKIDSGFAKILREEGSLTLTSTLTLTPKFSLGGGVGVIGALQLGVNGSVEVPVKFDFAQDYQEVRLIGSMKLTATALFVFSAQREVLHGEWVLYPRPAAKAGLLPLNQGLLLPDLSQSNNYEPLKRDYVTKTSKWLPNTGRARIFSQENSNFTTLQSSVLPNSMPQLLNVNGKTILIFQGDDPARDDNNRTVLLYSVNDNNSWSTPVPVWDNGAPDFAASVETDGVNAYIIWQKAAKPYEAAPGQDINQQMTDMAALSEIAAARWDAATNSFTDQSYVTNNNTFDMLPSVTISNGKPYIAWVNNDNNNVFGTSGKNTLMTGNKASGSWMTAATDVSDSKPVMSDDIAVTNGKVNVAYTVDMDQDLNTNEDIELYLYSDGNKRLTNNNAAETAPKFDGSMLYWYSGKGINTYNLQTEALSTAGEKTSVSSSFKIFRNESGKKAIVWTVPVSQNETSIRAMLQGDNGWGKEIEIANRPDSVQFFDGAFTEDGKWNIAANVINNSLPEPEASLVFADLMPRKDIALKSVFGDDLKRNNNVQPIMIEVMNSGDKAVDSLNLTVLDSTGQNTVGEQNIETSLNPGDSATIPVNITLPALTEKTEFLVRVDTDEETDSTDNQQKLILGYTDVSLKVTPYVSDDKVVLVSQVSNLSDIPTNVAITISEDSADGIVLDMKNLGTINGEDDIIYTYEIDKNNIDFKGKSYKAYNIKVQTSNEELTFGDNSETIVVDAANPSEYTGEPGEPIQIVNATGVKITNDSPIRLFCNDESEDNESEDNKSAIQLQAEVLPANATFKDVIWSVSDNSILDIDSNGNLKAIAVGNADVTVTSMDGEYTDTVPVEVLPSETEFYNLRVLAGTGGTVTTDSSGDYIAGDIVSIGAKPDSGYKFVNWTSSDGGTFANANNASTTFTMPANSATITANFARTGGTGGGGGGSSSQLAISTASLTDATVGKLYSATIVTNGSGTAPYTFSVSTGALPEGLNLASATGVISGSPTKAGSYNFTVTVKDKNSKTATKSYTLKVNGSSSELTDIAGHWANNSITKLMAMGAITGYPDATFKPDSNITRAEFATALVKAFELTPQTGKVYEDTANHWAKDYIATAESYGIVSGYDASHFGPDDLITREQMTVMVVKAAKLSNVSKVLTFTDSEAIAPWAKASVTIAVANQMIKGYPDNSFKPQGNTTRAEAVTVLVNALK